MEIAIFKEITTEGVIVSIEENSEKYHKGFYADMNNAPERKLVKESAAEIGGMIKELETARIKITKANTAKVNKEHKAIVERLTLANKPFTTLIDDYAAERKVILDAEKLRKQTILDAEQKELDHEMGLLINKSFEFDRAEERRIGLERLAKVQEEARIKAEADQKLHNKQVAQNKINAENARLANKEYLAKVHNTILAVLLDNGIDEPAAKIMIRLAAKGQLPQLTINY